MRISAWRASGAIRILAALAIQKTKEGTIKSLGATDLTPKQRKAYGTLGGALLGLEATGAVQRAQEDLPSPSADAPHQCVTCQRTDTPHGLKPGGFSGYACSTELR
jgi:hypothetical protein